VEGFGWFCDLAGGALVDGWRPVVCSVGLVVRLRWGGVGVVVSGGLFSRGRDGLGGGRGLVRRLGWVCVGVGYVVGGMWVQPFVACVVASFLCCVWGVLCVLVWVVRGVERV